MDSIMYWNEVALEANRVSHTNGKGEQTGPPLSARALAIVHLAMYDAFAGVSGNPAGLTAYLTPGPVAGASHDAAVAAAAHATLSKLFPSQKPFFDLKHAQAGLQGPGLTEGHEFGLVVAQKILDDRKDDPGVSDDGYAGSIAHGAHRHDPDNPDKPDPQSYHAPFYGARCKLFAVTDREPLRLDDPPQPGDPDYTTALQEVRRKGIAPELMGTLPANSSRRTVDETLIGVYWGYDGARELGTPPRLYNQIVRKVAENKNNTPEQNARLFAFVNTAIADAGILSWEEKYRHDLWRPVLGIREHDESMGPAGVGNNNIDNDSQPDWLPLGAPLTNSTGKNFTPPFPAYPSGHATFGAAAFQITRLFYNVPAEDRTDNLFHGLSFVSDEYNGISKDNKGAVRPRHVREFPDGVPDGGLWKMIIENGRSRVFLGVHWVFDAFAVKNNGEPDLDENIGGVPLGLNIAENIFQAGGGNAPKKP
jgi:vanadium chloroperoxidase